MKRFLTVLLCALMLLTVFVGCGEKKPMRTVSGSLVFTEENFPKIAATPYTFDTAINYTVAALGIDAETAKTLVTVCDTTDECYIKLINKECDVVIAHEYGSVTEKALSTNALRFEATEIGRDALVFLTNGAQTVDDVTVEQLKTLWSGETADWKTLGTEECEELPVTLFTELPGTAVQNAFEHHIKVEVAASAVKRPLKTEKGDFAADVYYDNRNGALGYALLSRSGNFSGGSIKPLKINSVEPTVANVQSGAYPFTINVNISIRISEPTLSNARLLYNWMVSEQGKKCVVPLY